MSTDRSKLRKNKSTVGKLKEFPVVIDENEFENNPNVSNINSAKDEYNS